MNARAASVGEALRVETVGERLRRLRLACGLSQRELSSPGVSYAYISRIEAGARTPSVKALRQLAPKLGVTVEYLETGRDETLVDELIAEVYRRSRSPVRITALPRSAFVRWKTDDVEMDERGHNVTEALLGAVFRLRERDEIRAEEQLLDERLRRVYR